MEKFVVEFPEENTERKKSRIPPKHLNLGSRDKRRLGGKNFQKERALFHDVIQWRTRPEEDTEDDCTAENKKYTELSHGILQVEAELWCHVMQHFSEFPVALGMSFYRSLANIWIGHSFRPNLLTDARKAQAEHEARDNHTAGGLGKLHPLFRTVLEKSQPRKVEKLSQWENLLRKEEFLEIDSLETPAGVANDYFEGIELQEQFDLADLISRLFAPPSKKPRSRQDHLFGTNLSIKWTPYHPATSSQCLPGLNSLSVLKALYKHGKWPLTLNDLTLVDGTAFISSITWLNRTTESRKSVESPSALIDPVMGTLCLILSFASSKRYDLVEALFNLLPPDVFPEGQPGERFRGYLAIPGRHLQHHHVLALCEKLLSDEAPADLWGKFVRNHLSSDESRAMVNLRLMWSVPSVLNSNYGRMKVLGAKDCLVHHHEARHSYGESDEPHYQVSWGSLIRRGLNEEAIEFLLSHFTWTVEELTRAEKELKKNHPGTVAQHTKEAIRTKIQLLASTAKTESE